MDHILLSRKRLEASLINWACSAGMIVSVPATYMRHRHPLHVSD